MNKNQYRKFAPLPLIVFIAGLTACDTETTEAQEERQIATEKSEAKNDEVNDQLAEANAKNDEVADDHAATKAEKNEVNGPPQSYSIYGLPIGATTPLKPHGLWFAVPGQGPTFGTACALGLKHPGNKAGETLQHIHCCDYDASGTPGDCWVDGIWKCKSAGKCARL